MNFTWDYWKRVLAAILFTVVGTFLIAFQIGNGYVSFANTMSQRFFVELCLLLIAVGVGLFMDAPMARFKYGLASFMFFNLGYILIGSQVVLNDALNGTSLASSGYWFGLDSAGAVATTFDAVVKTVIGAVPVIILVVGIVSVFAGDSADEYQSAAIEIIIAIVLLCLFGFAGKYFGFSF
jgi:hypothetical protein